MSQVTPPLSDPLEARPARRVALAGVAVDAITIDQALGRIDALIAGPGGTVFTPNVDHVVRSARDPAFAAAYARCPLQLCDGAPVKWAAAPLGGVPTKLSGSVFLPRLVAHAGSRGLRVYFVGGRAGVAERLWAQLPDQFPGLKLVGVSPATRELGAPGGEALARVADELSALRPDLVLVSLTVPQQELWADAVHARIGQGVFVCTGSAVDILVGLVAPAPATLSRCGLEWLWRMVHEPRRLAGRYLRNAAGFPPLVARAWWRAITS